MFCRLLSSIFIVPLIRKSSDEKGILAIATSGGTVQYFQLQKKENEVRKTLSV